MKILIAFLLGAVAQGAVSARTSNADPLPPKARKIQETAGPCEPGLNADPLFYLSAENGARDFSSLVSCTTDDELTTCDYSALLAAMAGSCELNDLQLYNVSLNHVCPGVARVIETNVPVCLGTTCDIEAVLVPRLLARFGSCDQQALSIEATRRNRTAVRGDACEQEMEVLTAEADVIGNPGWVYTSEELLEQFCSFLPAGGFSCDFTPLHATVAPLCTRQGGILYHYSDTVTDAVTNTSDESVQTYSNPSIGVPVCLGQSCDPETYFNELIVPHYLFSVNGDFTATANGTTSAKVYEFDAFVKVADSLAGTGETGDGNTAEDGGVSSASTSRAAPVHFGLVCGSIVVMVQMMVTLLI